MSVAHYEEIANILTREILTGQYRAGERLPSERDLASRFDMSRGAVREAIKKLDALGIAVVQPGGVRVAPVEEASLDVIGHMLSLEDIPRQDLAEQILEVLSALLILAAEATIERATDDQIRDLRGLVARLTAAAARGEEDLVARMELMSTFMEISGNLVTRLIARGLLMQFIPRMQGVAPDQAYGDMTTYRAELQALDNALAERDRYSLRTALEALGTLNRQHVARALKDARAAQTQTVVQL